MNNSSLNKRPVRAQLYGTATAPVPLRTDALGRPVMQLDAVQTIAASSFDIRNLSASDIAMITATDFDIRALNGATDSVTTVGAPFVTNMGTATILLGGTTVLTVDLSPYANNVFVVRADSISLATTVNLQLAPVNSANYFTTVASQGGLLLGGRYILIPTATMKYARITASGVGSVLTAYHIGQV
jgi:hypothetical protein